MKKTMLIAASVSVMLSVSMFIQGCNKTSPTSPTATATITIPTPIATADGAVAQATIVLGTSANYAILSNSAISNVPSSTITGDVGISPGVRANITGLTAPEVAGTIYASDDSSMVATMLTAAKTAGLNAYTNAINAGRGTATAISGNINSLTLVPGLYESSTSIEISSGGFLYLDGKGDPNAVFIIRSATTITILSNAEVVLMGSAQAKNVFWIAGSAITLGTNSKMKGTLIASTSISCLTGSNLLGRAIVQGASAAQITLDHTTITKP